MKKLNPKCILVPLAAPVFCAMSSLAVQANTVYSAMSVADSGQNTHLGQSFKVHGQAGAVELDAIRLRSAATLGDAGNHAFRATLKLYSSSSESISQWSPSGLLGESYPVEINPEKDGLSTVYSFSFNKQVVLEPSGVYLIELVNVKQPSASVRISFGKDKGSNAHSVHGCSFIGVGTSSQKCLSEFDFGMEVVAKSGAVEPKTKDVKVLLDLNGVSIGLQPK